MFKLDNKLTRKLVCSNSKKRKLCDKIKNAIIFLYKSDKGTFKYHMTLREGVCSNRQSTVIWVDKVWPNRHITFTLARKA